MIDKEEQKIRRAIRRKQLLAGPKQRAYRIPDKKKKANKEACKKGQKYDVKPQPNETEGSVSRLRFHMIF